MQFPIQKTAEEWQAHLAAQQAEPEHRGADRSVDDDELPLDVAELALDRRLRRADGAEELLHAADLG